MSWRDHATASGWTPPVIISAKNAEIERLREFVGMIAAGRDDWAGVPEEAEALLSPKGDGNV